MELILISICLFFFHSVKNFIFLLSNFWMNVADWHSDSLYCAAGVSTVVESAGAVVVVVSAGFFALDLLLAPLLGLMSEVTSSFNWRKKLNSLVLKTSCTYRVCGREMITLQSR